MSGNFVQRGEPAIINKYERCKNSIDSGVDLVLQIPTIFSLQSAENFALGSYNILEDLKAVDKLSFGVETDNFNNLFEVAKYQYENREKIEKLISEHMKSGKSYPKAYELATKIFLTEEQEDIFQSNNILALEYIKAKLKNNSSIELLPIKRKGSSFHKNLPALTPAAALLINDDKISNKLRFAMSIFQTSSPSYLVLQSIDYILENINELKTLNKNMQRNLFDLYRLNLENLSLIDSKNKDKSKILISTKNTNINGKELAHLLKKEKIEIEMAYPSYTLLIATLFDTNRGFNLLKKALVKIDKEIIRMDNNYNFTYKSPQKIYEIYEAIIKKSDLVPLDKAKGKIAADFTYAYPPGIPILAPGELISEEILENINNLTQNNININLYQNLISVLIDKRDENC